MDAGDAKTEGDEDLVKFDFLLDGEILRTALNHLLQEKEVSSVCTAHMLRPYFFCSYECVFFVLCMLVHYVCAQEKEHSPMSSAILTLKLDVPMHIHL